MDDVKSPRRALPPTRLALFAALAATSAAVFTLSSRRDTAEQHVRLGRQYAALGKTSAAENEWAKAVELDPRDGGAWDLLAASYLRDENYDAAVEPLRRLAALRPDSPQVFERLNGCLSMVADPAGTLQQAEAALRRDPEDIGALAIAVKVTAKSDQEQKRLAYLRRMCSLRPHDEQYSVLLARTLTNAHLYEEAAPVIEQVLARDPRNVDAYGLRGRRLLDTGRTPQELARAESDFLKALSLNPDGPMIHLQLGKLYQRRGQDRLAIGHLETAARLLPSLPEIFFVLASAYGGANLPEKAAVARKRFAALRIEADTMKAVEKRCAANPESFDLHLRAGLLALNRADLDKADYYLSRARALRRDDPRPGAALNRLAALANEARASAPEPGQ